MSTVGLQGRALGSGVVLPQHLNRGKNKQYTATSFLSPGAWMGSIGYGDPTAPTAPALNLGFIPSDIGGTLPIIWTNTGAQTILAPAWTVSGLSVAGDLTDTAGVSYQFGTGAENVLLGKHVYTVGTGQGSATTCFAKLTWNEADVSGVTTSFFGFCKVQALQAALTGYTDVAGVGLVGTTGDIKTRTRLNNGTAVVVDTGLNWADGESHTAVVEVNMMTRSPRITVDSSIVLEYGTFTFDSGDSIVPFFIKVHATTSPGVTLWSLFASGWETNKSVDAPFAAAVSS